MANGALTIDDHAAAKRRFDRSGRVAEVGLVASSLDAFNLEYDDLTPGVDVLPARLERLVPTAT